MEGSQFRGCLGIGSPDWKLLKLDHLVQYDVVGIQRYSTIAYYSTSNSLDCRIHKVSLSFCCGSLVSGTGGISSFPGLMPRLARGSDSSGEPCVQQTGFKCGDATPRQDTTRVLASPRKAAVVQGNHACFGIRWISKRTGSNPVHGPSVGLGFLARGNGILAGGL
ncbi:hypothetical protein E2C01_050603 [Portunus trituberculatus]|uniref:Uncharacterized protein n=1 Tax=Portunus trituberculatus TaxID=210409 RepID=A0A5B7GHZ7_PORTR|nr:hypothetical protein [Portunus trituberculatus]